MTYLITGGSGFIGSHLTEYLLKNGHSVINVDNFDDFYHYEIKIENTLESVNSSEGFEYKDKETDIQNLINKTKSNNYQLYCQDIRDIHGLKQIFQNHHIDVVIHLAALAGVRPSIEGPMEYAEVNILGFVKNLGLKKSYALHHQVFMVIMRKFLFLKQIM